ncbi:MAG: histidine kinase [Melioribacteraceae bacterium]|nr:histidine kinase [Melioribacteraceae bacterium]MCF8353186.1 histidine kinase [Melioribacteraceae bacterium]MCF8395150.1 histidine kinase [Melioribacteraceae bacterium]MCF8418017.1 histidine kinase [Melioribacteraceae bacterium]
MNLFEGSNKLKLFLGFFLIATVMALWSASINISAELAERYNSLNPEQIYYIIVIPLIDEFSGVFTFCLLIPAILAFFKKFPMQKDNLLRMIPLYLIFSIIVGLTHTTMMYISRSYIYPAIGFGHYDYGYIPFRILMEYLKQFILFWAVFAVFTLIKINKEKEAQRLKTLLLEEKLTRARLETLKMQLNPHFLFNTLNMISSTMYDDIEAADKMMASLSDLLRITLSSSEKGLNNLGKEMEILGLYTEIMKARFKDKLNIQIDIAKNTKNSLVPSFILQPLVENSIKHAMENLSETSILLTTKKLNDKLIIQIKDNGPGIHLEFQKVVGSGVGLSNTIERLEKLYGDQHSFTWENLEEGGLLLNIEIPYSEQEEI